MFPCNVLLAFFYIVAREFITKSYCTRTLPAESTAKQEDNIDDGQGFPTELIPRG